MDARSPFGRRLTSSLGPGASTVRQAVDHKEGAMALLEQEAIRLAESLHDYEHVTVTDIGGWGPDGF
jgi:hypothetical protein